MLTCCLVGLGWFGMVALSGGEYLEILQLSWNVLNVLKQCVPKSNMSSTRGWEWVPSIVSIHSDCEPYSTKKKTRGNYQSKKNPYESLTCMISKTFAKSQPLLAHLPSEPINLTQYRHKWSSFKLCMLRHVALTQGSTWWYICIKIIKHVQRRCKLRVFPWFHVAGDVLGSKLSGLSLSLHGFLKCFFWRMYCLEI